MLLDGGGTIVLPNRRLVAEALAGAGVKVDPADVPRAHYAAVRALDSEHAEGAIGAYEVALCEALGTRRQAAIAALSALDDRGQSGKVLWSEPTPGALPTISALLRAGVAVLVVTNSDGHAAENLRDAGILGRSGLHSDAVVDSALVGSSKPDTGIFEAALARAGVRPGDTVHVGDMLSTDIEGAHASAITPIHFDPYRRCRRGDHRHVRSLPGIWAHVGRRI